MATQFEPAITINDLPITFQVKYLGNYYSNLYIFPAYL